MTFRILVRIPRNPGLRSRSAGAGHFTRSRSAKWKTGIGAQFKYL